MERNHVAHAISAAAAAVLLLGSQTNRSPPAVLWQLHTALITTGFQRPPGPTTCSSVQPSAGPQRCCCCCCRRRYKKRHTAAMCKLKRKPRFFTAGVYRHSSDTAGEHTQLWRPPLVQRMQQLRSPCMSDAATQATQGDSVGSCLRCSRPQQ